MKLVRTFKNYIIKELGGYTAKEYERSVQRYKALLDSMNSNDCSHISNYRIECVLREIRNYMRTELYGLNLDVWVKRAYWAIENNYYRILARYNMKNSSIPYKFDKTLDGENQFRNILVEDKNIEALNYLDDNDESRFILETD